MIDSSLKLAAAIGRLRPFATFDLPLGADSIADVVWRDPRPMPTQAEVDAVVGTPNTPAVVSRFQARAALHQVGLLDMVEAMMADSQTPVIQRLAWTDAQEFRRDSPTVLAMASALGLTDADLDALFIAAAQIVA